jgi:hypothetical protein
LKQLGPLLALLLGLVFNALAALATYTLVSSFAPLSWATLGVVAYLTSCSFAASVCSEAQGRSTWEGYCLGALLGPIGVVAAAFLAGPGIAVDTMPVDVARDGIEAVEQDSLQNPHQLVPAGT